MSKPKQIKQRDPSSCIQAVVIWGYIFVCLAAGAFCLMARS